MGKALNIPAIHNWSPAFPVIRHSELGWQKGHFIDAESEDPEIVFNFYWKHCLSIVFYYVDDGNFYELFMEGNPFKFWKVHKLPKGKGQWIAHEIPWNDHEEGEVLFTFTDDTDLWGSLTLQGVPIGEVLSRSFIAEINY